VNALLDPRQFSLSLAEPAIACMMMRAVVYCGFADEFHNTRYQNGSVAMGPQVSAQP